LNIAGAYYKTENTGITPDIAIAALSDATKRDRLGKLMKKFRDKNHEHGFDGALAYDVKDEKIFLYGISPLRKVKIYASVLPMEDLHNTKKINLAICHALVNIPVLAEP
jgi:hypothetical protein